MGGKKYSIGVDYGTQSGRAVLVDVSNGMEIATHVTKYNDGVIDKYLPGTDIKLGQDFALQNADDYLDVLFTSVPKVLEMSKVDPKDVIGIGIDFTACTMMPVDKDGMVLAQKQEFKDNPHAWTKLWKHHAAQSQANKLNEIAESRGERFLQRYGGKISSEWFVPKVWEILIEAPELYDAAYKFMDAADWITMQLTGVETRNSCTAGYKDIYHKKEGFPSSEFFKALDPRLENFIDEKMNRNITPIGEKAGELTEYMAEKMNLMAGTAISIGNVDAHVSVPAAGIVSSGKMLMVMGTSICHMLLGDEEKIVSGMCGVVEDGIIPGFYGYEAGQSAVGDIFEWCVNNCVPESYMEEAREKGVNIHELLTEKASNLKPGENGLLALDWWNGNRSILVDADLTGLIIGATLLTKPEEIYRALIEATAFGTNAIIENFNDYGVPVKELYACGGLPKNKMLMQIYADVTNLNIYIAESSQTPALGSAMFGAVAAGRERGGYDSVFEAADKMARIKEEYFKPIPENVEVYKKLYGEYKKLHDYFGRGENNVMKTLKKIKSDVCEG